MLERQSQARLVLQTKETLYHFVMVENNRIGARIAKARRAAGITQAALANKLGVSPQAVSGWERGEAAPEVDKVDPIASALGVSVLFLMSSDPATFEHYAQKIESRRPPVLIRPSGPEPSEVTKVGEGWPDIGDDWMDVRGVTVGGDDSFFYFGDVIDQVRRPPGIRNAKNVAALNVAGESMVPRFEPGELIYVQLREPAPGDDVVIELYPETEGDAPKSFLKRLIKKTGRRLECRQHNPASLIEFDRGEVKNLWRVLTLRDLLG